VVARQASEANRISYEQYVDYLDRNPWFLKAAATEGEEKVETFTTHSELGTARN
jgi:hypothetical protein